MGNRKPDERLAALLDNYLSIIHVIGNRLLGPLWITFFESVQDAVALGCLVQIPSFLSKIILGGKEFTGLNMCWANGSLWSVSNYACTAVVLSDYTLWAVLIFRILFRCYRDLKKLTEEKSS